MINFVLHIEFPCYFITQVKNFHGSELQKQLAETNLSFPLIVKPQVACGVADAHNMVACSLCIYIHVSVCGMHGFPVISSRHHSHEDG
jgi:hypothetical protein